MIFFSSTFFMWKAKAKSETIFLDTFLCSCNVIIYENELIKVDGYKMLSLMMILEIKGIHQICQSFPPQNFAFHILIIFCSFGVFLCLLICCRSSTNLQITFPSCSFLWLKQKTKWNIRLVTKTKQHIPSARNKNDQIKPKSRYSRTKI